MLEINVWLEMQERAVEFLLQGVTGVTPFVLVFNKSAGIE